MGYHWTMSPCPSCGEERSATSGACPKCGAFPTPELALPSRGPRPAKPEKAIRGREKQLPLELAVDPRMLVAERSTEVLAPALGILSNGAVPLDDRTHSGAAPAGDSRLAVNDLACDAQLLADFGNPPTSWTKSPFYAWRVIRRRRELGVALLGRRGEALHAASEVEDALVALGERVRTVAEQQPTFALALEELRGVEDLFRSRDRVLAAEQDAQNARLVQVDARLIKLEEEHADAQAEERRVEGELAEIRAALARDEAKLKRAESELRAIRQRGSVREAGE
jgi:hypothetical protein